MAISILHDKLPEHSPGGVVLFEASVDDARVECEISDEALRDHFGAGGDDENSLIAAFENGRRDIELLALMKLNVDPIGKCHIGTGDFKKEARKPE
jgi:hypothetical protein